MKTKLLFRRGATAAFALLMVMVIVAASVLIMAGTLSRTYTVAKLNDRSNRLMQTQNAAEAAVEKVYSQMQADFQSRGGAAQVTAQLLNGTYRDYPPSGPLGVDAPYWTNFVFLNPRTGNVGTYVNKIGTFTGELPGLYQGRYTKSAPLYRIVSNVQWQGQGGSLGIVGTAQEDVILGLLPLTTYAIFYDGLLEFSTCATMTVNGPVHSNAKIYVGAGSGSGSAATLNFNNTVTTSGTITAPYNNGQSWTGPTNYNSANWNTWFNGGAGTNGYNQGVASIQIPIPMTNSHALIEIPSNIGSPVTNVSDQQKLYNLAQVIIMVSNTSVSVVFHKSPSSAQFPGDDTSHAPVTYTLSSISTNLPFLSITNKFADQREDKTNLTTQIDVGKYAAWLTDTTNNSALTSLYPLDGSSGYATILFVSDNRTSTNGLGTVVRLTNGIAPPNNGGQGFTVATPNPLYVWGNYNCTNNSYLGTTNTTATVPCAFMSDALTILSANWSDSVSMNSSYSDSSSSWNAASAQTVNAAILTGIKPSTGTNSTNFSGGVHNLPRLLENWSSSTLWLNTSIINLFNSTVATGQFQNPGNYYRPPTRKFSYDLNFSDPNKVPPGIPCALVAMRYNWLCPPVGSVSNNVVVQ